MIGFIVVGLLLLVLLVTLAIALWMAASRRWEQRAEWTRVDREVRQAEHQLHNLAIRAFGSMLDTARGHSKNGCEWHP